MKVSDLIKKLSHYDNNIDVGMMVSYVECNCTNDDEYCYCSSHEHDFYISSISTEEYKGNIKKIWIHG